MYYEAIEQNEAAIRIDSEDTEAWYHKALALHSLGKYDEAIESYDRAVIIGETFDALYGRARSKAKKGDFGGVLTDLEKVRGESRIDWVNTQRHLIDLKIIWQKRNHDYG